MHNKLFIRENGLPFYGILAIVLYTAGPWAQAEQQDEGNVIHVESTTIDDKFENKRDEASSVAVISGEKVDKAHTENIQQLLQSVPGVTTELQAGDSLKIHIRGIENQVYMGEKPGVAVVIDGVPVFERTGRVNIDMDNIESIKVIKGGASYLFGDDALAGAVIITTKRGAQYEGYTLGAEAGSFGYTKGLARAGFSNESANGHVQVSRRATDGYYDDSGSSAEYLNGKLMYYLDDTSDLSFGFERSDRHKNSHGAVKGEVAAQEDPRSTDIYSYNDYANHYDVDLGKYFLTYSKDFNEHDNLMVNLYHYGDETEFFSKPNSDDPRLYENLNLYDQVQRGLKSEYRSSGETLAWMAAVDLRDNRYENNVEAAIDIDDWSGTTEAGTALSDDATDETVQAVYGEVKYRLAQPLVMTVNGRYDHIEYDYSSNLSALDLKRDFNVTSWRLGMNYELADNRDLYANISTGFRAPSVKQLFIGDIDPSEDTDSNPDLEPEHAINKEIGFRTQTELFGKPAELDLAVFQIDRRDYIMKTSGQYAMNDVTNDYFDNIGGIRNRGLELTLSGDPSDDIFWNLAYTFIDARYTDYDNFNLLLGNRYGRTGQVDCSVLDPDNSYCIEHYDNNGNRVPRVPRHHLNLSMSMRVASHWTFTGELDAISSYFADEINRVEIDGHETFNLLINYDHKLGKSDWSWFLRIDNLFDQDYYNTARGGTGDAKTVDSDGDGIYDSYDGVYDANDISIVVNPGRVYTAGLSVSF
ncbi:MAG: TonB-dependent receptor [Chromatiales bacterium]|jgi:iron complex outermembrane receptor protein